MTTPPEPPRVTVLITTRDRRERLRQALRSCAEQVPAPEVLVIDDASTDGTADMVRAEFPNVRLERSETSLGCPAQRNRGVALASGEIVLCLDDDAWFSSPRVVGQTTTAFDADHVAVVTVPYVNVRRETFVRQRAPAPGRWAAGTFAGGASAVRRSAFLACGGYAEFRLHGEETDLAVRLLDRGLVIRLGSADHVVHDETTVRKSADAYAGSSRNHLLTVWRTVPWPMLPARLVVVALKVIVVGARGGRVGDAVRGVASAARAVATRAETRLPVAPRTYRTSRRLLRRGPLSIDEVMRRLPG